MQGQGTLIGTGVLGLVLGFLDMASWIAGL